MFAKIAEFIIRHYKAIIVSWILILIIAVPIAPMAFGVVKYEETEMAPENIESIIAQQFINEHFPSAGKEGTTIIVLTNENAFNEEMKRTVFKIKSDIINETLEGRIDGNVRVDTLYDSLTLYSTGVLKNVHSSYYELKYLANLTGYAIFGIPTGFRELWKTSNQTSSLIFGIPATHLAIWVQTSYQHPDWNVTAIDDAAYINATGIIMYTLASQDLNDTERAFALGWYSTYVEAWNATRGTPIESNGPLRADVALESFSYYLEIIPLPADFKTFFSIMYDSFTLNNWNNFHLFNVFTKNLFLGEAELISELPSDYQDLFLGYFDTFYALWNSSSSEPNDLAFVNMVEQSVNVLSGMIGGDEGEFIKEVYANVGWNGWDNQSVICNFVSSVLAEKSHVNFWLVDAVGNLPPNASLFEIHRLAAHLVENSSITDFPLPVIPALLSSFVNVPKNDTMIVLLTYESADSNGSPGKESIGVVREIARSASTSAVAIYVTGSDAISTDMESSMWEDIKKIDPITVILVFVLIGLFFRSFVASSIPPAIIGIALGVSLAAVYAIGSYILPVHYSVPTLMVTSMMGAGCDYCIFILSRYREERRNGLSKEESVRTAVTWAGESIATSGATVIIGFGVLSLGRFEMLKSMGVGLALGITIALLAALTLLPSILMLLGDKVMWPSRIDGSERNSENETGNEKRKHKVGYFTKSATFAVKHAKAIVLVAIVVSIPSVYLVLTLDTSYDFIQAMPDNESKIGINILSESFGAGRMLPTYIAIEMEEPVLINSSINKDAMDAIENMCENLSKMSSVADVVSPSRPLGEDQPINYANLSVYPPDEAAQYLSLIRNMISENNSNVVLITLSFKEDPFAKESIDSINEIRAFTREYTATNDNIRAIYVAGSTAIMYDISTLVWNDFKMMEVVAIIGIYIVLMIVLGSIISPLRSIITILLSISWTIAATMLLFNFLQGVPILWLMPMVLTVVCLGLGMDYDIFITTRIREEAQKGKEDTEAIVHAMERTGGIITACGIIMAGAFGTMLLSQGSLLREFGFALAFAILVDSTIVRIYLVPAVMSLLGKWNWYAPGNLQRVRREEKYKKK
ncbi:MAG: MMPL family transporter [Methanomassiliicoccales archaeon]